MAVIPPCTRAQLPAPSSVPVGSTGTLLDEGNAQVYDDGYEPDSSPENAEPDDSSGVGRSKGDAE